jgi:hypothetical protein
MSRKKDSDNSSEDDVSLFRRLMDDAKPLQPTEKAPEHRPTVSARARFKRQDERAALRESLEADIDESESGAGESLRFHRPSVGRRTMRKLARGNFSVQDEIDLHGMTVPEAKEALQEFVGECELFGQPRAGHKKQGEQMAATVECGTCIRLGQTSRRRHRRRLCTSPEVIFQKSITEVTDGD